MKRKRVVLLARAGAARERTQAAIVDAGGDVVACLDPGEADEDAVRAADPGVLMVVLDPAVEHALERFDAILGDPSIEAIFEDADVAMRREGWEAARWARHLAAKLQGHDDVLPRTAAPLATDAPVAAADDDARFQDEIAALQLRVAAMPALPHGNELAQAPRLQGAVAVAAGVGGPDAVRQLLGGLPGDFPRPVLLRQRIDGGQYEKLVRQMQRAGSLRVVLAQPGDTLAAGTVHVLPDGMDVHAAPAGLVVVPGEGEPRFAALPAGDSAILLLSGADPMLVERALSVALGGGLALGQSAENCFDPAASQALVARGGQADGIAGLVHRLQQRWPA